MPRPPIAMCGHEPLWVCERCGACGECCKCSPAGALVSINSRKAAEAIRTAMREKQLGSESLPGMGKKHA